MSGTIVPWYYYTCCKCNRDIIPNDVDTCPSCKEKRCAKCPADKLYLPPIESCNLTSQIPSKASKIMLITLIAYLRSLFTQPVAPEVPWWNCRKCDQKTIPKDEDACPGCKEKRCAKCPVDTTQLPPIPRPTE